MVLDAVSSINGHMATTKEILAEERLASFLQQLGQQIIIPGNPRWSRYDDEADVVYVGFTENGEATRSDELNDYVILDYRGDQLVGIEILNASLHV